LVVTRVDTIPVQADLGGETLWVCLAANLCAFDKGISFKAGWTLAVCSVLAPIAPSVVGARVLNEAGINALGLVTDQLIRTLKVTRATHCKSNML
jgi:hypothetical protein